MTAMLPPLRTPVVAFALLLGAAANAAPDAPVTAATRAAQAATQQALPPDDGEDAEFAARGFIATWPEATIKAADGRVVWDFAALDRLKGPAPATVNPSLWRQALLMARHGLFKVADRVYQVRGFDLSVMTIIVGDKGYILVDPLLTTETAHAALQLVRQQLGDKPVTGLIYTHSHSDHFGGALGVVDAAAAKSIPIIAPDRFLEEVVAENLIAGNAMTRRAIYQFGATLPFDPSGQVNSGIGPALARGTISLLPPNDSIRTSGDTRTIDGVQFEFQLTPNTEAPAEMNFYLPQFRILHLAENANATMHNLLPARGALVRDAKAWADYLTQALRLYGNRSDIVLISHGWPRFGRNVLRNYIALHRDAYKYLHDQSVRLINNGLSKEEIAETIQLPKVLSDEWFNRGYYGTMRHNSKAVYQRYIGWYSGNPADLDPWPQVEIGKRYVDAMGGPKRVLALARTAYAAGDYRWVATLLDHLVFAGAASPEAKTLLADAYRQLGYVAEGSVWRNMYLTAAAELTHGARPLPADNSGLGRFVPTPMLLDLLAVRIVPERVPAQPFTVALILPEAGERHFLSIRNGVLVHETNVDDAADVSITTSRAVPGKLLAGGQLTAAERPQIAGNAALVPVFLGLFEAPDRNFPIVTP